MATLAGPITHDSGSPLTGHWTTVTDTNARMSVTVGSALGGSVEGVQCTHNTGFFNTFLEEPFTTPVSEELRFKWRYDPNGAQTPGSTTNILAAALTVGGGSFATIIARGIKDITSGGQNRITWAYGTDASTVTPQTTNITDAEHCFEISVKRAATAVSADGEVEFFIDGVSDLLVTAIDNFDLFPTIDTILMDFSGWDAAQGATIVYMDEVLLTDIAATGLCVTASPFDLIPSVLGLRE